MQTHYAVIIVGGGQAGLSMSYCLKEKGIDHIVFERHEIAHAWRTQRWDSFCLVTPNWQCQLPGYSYPGETPQGFMPKDEIVRYIEAYAQSFNPPVQEGVAVTRVSKPEAQGVFEVATAIGNFTADQVVIAVGNYHRPKLPALTHRLPDRIVQLHSSQYKNPASLPAGAVLVVGTGQSGCQIAEDLHLAGKLVHLSVGGAPRSPRRYRGKDVVEWLHQMGYYDLSIDDHPQKSSVRTHANHYLTGRDGGREIDLRRFALEGMQLHGRLKAVNDHILTFAQDLQQNLDQADVVSESIKKTIDAFIEKQAIAAPTDPPYQPLWQPPTPPAQGDLLNLDDASAKINTVIWSTGYEADFRWIDIPAFDGKGYPGHKRGVTEVWGLYFLGLPWLYTWGSGRFSGVARDAHYLAECIVAKQRVSAPSAWNVVNQFLLGS